jgi:O-antigen/teichoic acid export membrane protein
VAQVSHADRRPGAVAVRGAGSEPEQRRGSGGVPGVPGSGVPGAGGGGIDRLARDGLLGLVGAGVSAVFNLVVVVVVVHAAGKSVAGVVFAVTSLYLISVTIARLGSPTGLVYFLVRARTRGHADTMRRILRIGLAPVVVGSLVVAAVMLATAPVVARWIAPQQSAAAVLPLRVLALLVPVAAISDTLLMGSRGFNTMRPLILVERIGRPIGQVVLTVAAILVGAKSAVALTSAWALPYVVTAAVGLWWTAGLLHRAERGHRRRAETAGTVEAAAGAAAVSAADADASTEVVAEDGDGQTSPREYWVFTVPRALQSIVQIALQRLDIVLVSALIGPKEAAVYAAVTRFLVFGQLGAQAITAAVQPQLGAHLFAGDVRGAGRVYQVSTCWLILLTWPVYLSLAVFSRQIPAFFGHGYDAGTAVLVILGCAMLVATGAGLVDVVLAMAGRTTWTLGNSVLALVVDVSLNLILLPRIGIKGAAIAWAAAIVANNVLPVTQLAVSMRLHPFGRGTLLAMASAGCWLGLLPTAAGLVLGASAAVLVSAMAVGVAGYLATAWRLRGVFEIDALLRAARRRSDPDAKAASWS